MRKRAACLGAPPTLWFMPTAGLAIYIVAVYLFESPPVPLIAPDTASYWSSDPMRPLGYTAVLHTVYGLSGSFKYIPAIQSGAYCLAVLALQTAIWRLTRNIIFASIVAMVLLLYHGLLAYSIWALSEEIFIAILILHVAAAAWALAGRSRAALISMALTAVAIISLRPAGTFVLLAVLFFCLFWRGNRVFALRWAALPFAISMITFMGVGFAVRGIALDQLGGWAAFPYVAYIYDGSNDAPVVRRAIETFLEPYIRGHKAAERHGLAAVTKYETDHFNDIAYGLTPSLAKVLPGQDVSAREGRLAFETIERHPLQYLRLVAMTFAGGSKYALRTYSFDSTSIRIGPTSVRIAYREMSGPTRVISNKVGGLGSFNVDTDASRFGLVRDYPLLQLPYIDGWPRWILLLLFWSIALVSTFLALFRDSSRLVLFVAYTSTLTIGGYLFVAATTVFISRYTAPLDAFIIVTIASGVLEALRIMRRKGHALAEIQPQTGSLRHFARLTGIQERRA